MDVQTQRRKLEGRKSTVYKDNLGFWTIGEGVCVDDHVAGAGLRPEEIDFISTNRTNLAKQEVLSHFPWAASLNEPRQAVLILMVYQMGLGGTLAFKKAWAAAQVGDFDKSADELLDSEWSRETPSRAHLMAQQWRTGEWQCPS